MRTRPTAQHDCDNEGSLHRHERTPRRRVALISWGRWHSTDSAKRAYGGGEQKEYELANILLEIIASTVDDCVAAESGGADRIEFCAAIAMGGLTPSLGTLIEAKKRVQIPVMAMVRPRAGGFCYSDADFAVMRRDAALFLEHGADGIVFGILHSDGRVDTKRCGKMLELAGGRQIVFHRAFDVVPDPLRALEELIDLGFTRVLTSGQQKTALEGGDLIRRLVDHSQGRIEVLPGAGVRAHNVERLIQATGCTQVHLTAFTARGDASAAAPQLPTEGNCGPPTPLNFGGISGSPASAYEQVDRETVQRMRETLDAIVRKGE
jgi:copper homeostasis protein